MNDTNRFHQLSLAIYNAVSRVQQQQPEFLHEKYRSQPWGHPSHQVAFVEKLGQRLGKATDTANLLHEVDTILGILVTPEQLPSADVQQLVEDIRSLIRSMPFEWHQTWEAAKTLVQPIANEEPELQEAITVLLLDAENFQLNAKIESFLAKACTYPLRVKVAFANWRKLGKYDVDLHERGYDLIHVPTGQDMADGKMIVFGSSIHERYPATKEVLVCSSDKVMSKRMFEKFAFTLTA